MTTCNILLVDDEPANLLALDAILEPLQQNVVRATSGVDALRHALRTEFCVVLLDVQMPGMDGLETAKLLRRRPRTRDLPIIFLTAISTDEKWVARGYDVGAVDYLVKPYDPDVLRTKVATFVELGRKKARELDDFKRWSERRYEGLADSMPQIVWTAEASGRIVYKNQRWDDIAGSSPAAFSSLAHADDLASFTSGWENAIRVGAPWEAELRLGTPARGYRFHLVRAIPRHGERGKVLDWVGTATDIDARVRAERALRMLADASHRLNRGADGPEELEDVLRMALPLLGDAAILDLHGGDARGHESGPERRTVAAPGVDPAALDDPRFELGPSTVAYTGRPEIILDVDAEAKAAARLRDSPRGSELMRFLGELGVAGYLCLPLPTRERTIGTLSIVRFVHAPPFDESHAELAGDLARRIAVAIDNARLCASTERRREELELANRSKDVFLATLSHELRTPLNVIVGWTDLLQKGAVEGDELRRTVDTIDRNAHALSGLVADLLDVSRIVTGALKLESEPVSLTSIVRAAVDAARPQSASKNVSLELAAADDDAVVCGDTGRLRQIVTNILSNAIKFTPDGGSVSVSITAAGAARERVRVTVRDTGIGIPPDFLPLVFERFRQEERGGAKGLGLGLAIVKHLVEEHGGAVWAESQGRGEGAVIGFELPRSAETLATGEASEPRPAHLASDDLDLAGIHVLLVEDDPDGRELAATILARYGARVTTAADAGDALEALERMRGPDRPRLLLSDIGLPDMNGMELIGRVRALESESSSILAVALTAYASRQDASRALAAGFDAHVAKPVQPGALAKVIATLRTRIAPVAAPSSAA